MTKTTLLQIADHMRNSGRQLDVLALIQEAKKKGLQVDLTKLRKSLPRRTEFAEYYTQEFISDFITRYLGDRPPTRVLDPCVGLGGTLGTIVTRYSPEMAIGIEINSQVCEIASIIHEKEAIQFINGNALELMSAMQDRFDVVVADPPMGSMKRELILKANGDSVRVRDNVGNLLLLESATHLADDGVGFFTVPPSFMFSAGAFSVRESLNKFGLFINAALALPAGTFAPLTQIEGLLLIVSRRREDALFVGELSDNEQSREVLLTNLKARKVGRAPQLGALVEPRSFTSFSALLAHRELDEATRQLGLAAQPLADLLSEEIHVLHSSSDHGFEELPNAVYLPLIGRGRAVTSQADLNIKPHNCAQLVLDPNKASAVYVANFLNTPIGYRVRESLLSGIHIPKITKATLSQATLFLPDIDSQTRMLTVNTRITDLENRLDALRRDLWSKPRRIREVEREVRLLNRGNDFLAWIDTLPFPLASILWTYHAAKTSEQKIDHLIDFFEAYSEWTTAILLSGFKADLVFCEQEGVTLRETNPNYYQNYFRADFGTWNQTSARLSKALRSLLQDQEKLTAVKEMFGNPEDAFLELLSEKRTFAILEEVRKNRNEWRGHGGVSGHRDAVRRKAILEDSLASLRQMIADRYDSAAVISPVSAKYSEGLYTNVVKRVIGSRTPFQETLLDTSVPLDTKKLYLSHEGQLKPVPLIPFVRIMESPKTQQNACYFYNRVEKGEVRWVSYHFDTESDIRKADKEVEAALALLVPDVTTTN